MAVTNSSPELSEISQHELATELATVHQLHPPREGVFDPGELFHYSGEIRLRRETLDWTLIVPEHLAYEGLALHMFGYMGVKPSSDLPRDALADEGIPAVSYRPGRKGAHMFEGCTDPQRLHAITGKKIIEAITQRDDIIRGPHGKLLKDPKVGIMGHSMGGLGAVRLANLIPSRVDAVVEEAAVGHGYPTLGGLPGQMLKKLPYAARHEFLPMIMGGQIIPDRRILGHLAAYMAHPRFAFEGLSCLTEDSRPGLARLQSLGIFTAYMAYAEDMLVKPDPEIAHDVDYFEIMPDAGHVAPLCQAPRVARKVKEMIAGPIRVNFAAA